MAGEAEKGRSLATKSLDELADEMAGLPETSEAARVYHAELARRQTQAELDAATAQLASAKTKHSFWTVLILGAAMLATVVALMFQK